MRVLVTGALGFTGRAVVQLLLERDHDVTALTSRPSVQAPARAERAAQIVHGDLRDRDAIDRIVAAVRPDAVCHLAARTRVRDSLQDPVGYFDVNVAGTVHLLAALEARAKADTTSTPPRFVLASSGAVYGARAGVLSEDDATAPTNPYGASKLAAEQLVGFQAAAGRLAAVTLRCFNISGAVDAADPDTTRIIPKALAVAAGRADLVQVNGDGSALREYTHVRDVAHAYLVALQAAVAGEHLVLNVGSGHGVSVVQVIETARKVTGRAIPLEHLNPRPEPQVMIADSTRIRGLHWSPQCSDLETLIRDSWTAQQAAA